MKKIIPIVKIVLCICSVFVLCLCYYEQYQSPDALYAQDNYEYFLSRCDQSLASKLPTSKEMRSKPMTEALKNLYLGTTTWTLTYLQESHQGNITTENPYDTLARLILYANNEDVQNVYNTIQMYAATTNPEHPEMTEVMIHDILENSSSDFTEMMDISAQALNQIKFERYCIVIINLAMLLYLSISQLIKCIRHKKEAVA